MSPTTLVLIIVAVAVIAAIAFFTLRGRTPVSVATANANEPEDPALSASGEAMIVGDVMPIDSNEPGIPAGTAQMPPDPPPQDPRKAPQDPKNRTQVYEAPRRSSAVQRELDAVERIADGAPHEPDVIDLEPDTPECQSDASTSSAEDWATQRAEIRWSKRFEPRDGALDDATRLSLLRDLGIVRAPWGVPLLTQAYEEEPDIEHRRAALRALAAYRHPDTQPTFESALRADDEESRAIAATALGALRIRAALPS